jgi:hypothetical protein
MGKIAIRVREIRSDFVAILPTACCDATTYPRSATAIDVAHSVFAAPQLESLGMLSDQCP